MTKAEVKQMIAGLNIPYAYSHFAEGEAPSLPYVVFRYPNSNNFGADNKSYVPFDDLDIELYTEKRDLALEASLEALLDERDIFYRKSEVFIETEKVYEILYEMEMVVMG